MTDETKTAIKSAEKRLEEEKKEKLKEEIYQFLKQELGENERIDKAIAKLKEERRIHEENIKNVKSGNLKAIEDRKKALDQNWAVTWDWNTASGTCANHLYTWYNDMVAGITIKINGKTFIF